ncbi:MAG: aminoacyl-tRNA deacylase [Eubacteriales bacterium]|nr:aminoacyl-tRNA deacylase [Eubacteriales bacterium]
MQKRESKTNAMRQLDTAGIAYTPLYYDLGDRVFSGEAVCELLGVSADESFKTLCARGERNGVAVFVIPVSGELDLKKAAAAMGDKGVALVPVKELKDLTGYERGGVSPIGMKKAYPTFFDETAQLFDYIEVSGGVKGCSLRVEPEPLAAFLCAVFVPLTME